jgi:uncharacterized protein YjbI with pentapeptide repeats
MNIHRAKECLQVHSSDLWGSSFDDVNLLGCTFYNVNLSGATSEDANRSGWRIMM